MAEVKLTGRKIRFFRCQIDPSIGPKPRNAFDVKEMRMKVAELTPIGLYVKLQNDAEHVIPYSNIQKIDLLPEVAADKPLPPGHNAEKS